MVDISWVGNIIKSMYNDRLTIYRYTVSKDSNGLSRSDKSLIPVASDIPCSIAFDKADDSNTNDVATIPLSMGVKLFVGVDSGVRAGDSIVAIKNGANGPLKTYKGIAGEPKAYPSHYQIILLLDEADNG